MINVVDCGAKGDKSTDDTNAIQRAIDSLHPIFGGTVFLPPGQYILSRALIIRAPSTRILGSGRDETQLIVRDHTFDVFILRGADAPTAPWLNDITIEELWINSFGQRGDQVWVVRDDARKPGDLNSVQGTPDVLLRRIQMTGVHSGVLSLAGRFRADDLNIRSLREGCGIGIQIEGYGELRDILNVWMENAGGHDARAGILVRGAAATTIINCELMKMGRPLWVSIADRQLARSIQLLSSWFDTSSGPGMLLETSGSGSIARISADTCWFGSCQQGVVVDGNVWGLMIENSQIIDNARDGIFIAPGSLLRGALFNQIAVAANRGSGFHVGAGVGDFTLTNSILGSWADFGGNSAWGCLIEGDTDAGHRGGEGQYIVAGNKLRGNGRKQQICTGGASPQSIVRDNIVIEATP